jgi:16S rRNA (cytosine1402-N4)-methyltransferase
MVNEVKACFRLTTSAKPEVESNGGANLNQGSLSKSRKKREEANEISSLLEKPDAIFIDGTLGTGGHTLALLQAHPTCRVIAFDRDEASMQFAKQRLDEAGVLNRVHFVKGDFRRAPALLQKSFEGDVKPLFENLKIEVKSHGQSGACGFIDGALVDAGMSLYQVTWAERGLSFRADAPLDMRYDRQQEISAFDLVNRLSASELEDLLFKFTDERWARRIVAFIVARRNHSTINTTLELSQLIEAAIPASVRHQTRVHPATKTFAALRLAVNDEFWALEEGSWALSSVLANTARLVVLTYSSNEDRVIKHTFRRLAGRPLEREQSLSRGDRKKKSRELSKSRDFRNARSSLTIPLSLPYENPDDPRLNSEWAAGFGSDWNMKIVTPKPIEPTAEEIAANPLARSCKLRAVEKAYAT